LGTRRTLPNLALRIWKWRKEVQGEKARIKLETPEKYNPSPVGAKPLYP
jgi:hypothetical protein